MKEPWKKLAVQFLWRKNEMESLTRFFTSLFPSTFPPGPLLHALNRVCRWLWHCWVNNISLGNSHVYAFVWSAFDGIGHFTEDSICLTQLRCGRRYVWLRVLMTTLSFDSAMPATLLSQRCWVMTQCRRRWDETANISANSPLFESSYGYESAAGVVFWRKTEIKN